MSADSLISKTPQQCLNRKQFIKQILAGIGGMAFYGCMEKSGKSLPNIVMIISDDQGWTDYGFMGHPAIKTPCIDRLAGEGLTFTKLSGTKPTKPFHPSSLLSTDKCTFTSFLFLRFEKSLV